MNGNIITITIKIWNNNKNYDLQTFTGYPFDGVAVYPMFVYTSLQYS